MSVYVVRKQLIDESTNNKIRPRKKKSPMRFIRAQSLLRGSFYVYSNATEVEK